MSKKHFKIAAIYDTETTNFLAPGCALEDTRAFPCLFIFNDLTKVILQDYEPDNCAEDILFFRSETEVYEYIERLIKWGLDSDTTPIIAAYNLAFDLKPIIYELNQRYDMRTTAQSSTHIYTLDLVDSDENILLRFWDTFYLDMRGLDSMGNTCGFKKAVGSWDYSLIRTPETPLTDEELFYAKRDVQVIPAYLKFLIDSNSWLDSDMFGNLVITKTSLVRQMARNDIGSRKVTDKNGKEFSLYAYFLMVCQAEQAKTYEQYALRKACFRGGFTFTSARYASMTVRNVCSLDVTSMHHTFINGRMVPVQFTQANILELENAMWTVLETGLDYVLEHYEKPFLFGFHALFEVTNLRLREGSIFKRDHIALLAQSKLEYEADALFGDNQLNIEAENELKANGYKDRAINGVFAFGKLYSADIAQIYMNELELWTFAQVYDFDSIKPLFGEVSVNFRRPPDYVIAQSNVLYAQKDAMKQILKNYEEKPYKEPIHESIPFAMACDIQSGVASKDFLEGYYQSGIKGMFNGIYGTQAMDEVRPSYLVSNGELEIDLESKANADNYDRLKPKRSKVFYNYGARIVGGSRMHLVIAMMLLYQQFRDKMWITGGDTDSIKASLSEDITDVDLLQALKPLYEASDRAIKTVCTRLKANLPDLYTDMRGVGGFEVEKCSADSTRYAQHFEAWNKARCSLDNNGICHITAAGVARPASAYNVENLLTDMSAEHVFENIAPLVLGYNTNIDSSISYLLQRHTPKADDRFVETINDHLGNTSQVDAPQSIALYPCSRDIAALEKKANQENVNYLKANFLREVDTRIKILSRKNNVGKIHILTEEGFAEYV